MKATTFSVCFNGFYNCTSRTQSWHIALEHKTISVMMSANLFSCCLVVATSQSCCKRTLLFYLSSSCLANISNDDEKITLNR
jgi:predicted membrane channel-forming protein YqfA (hemolysin III family)